MEEDLVRAATIYADSYESAQKESGWLNITVSCIGEKNGYLCKIAKFNWFLNIEKQEFEHIDWIQ